MGGGGRLGPPITGNQISKVKLLPLGPGPTIFDRPPVVLVALRREAEHTNLSAQRAPSAPSTLAQGFSLVDGPRPGSSGTDKLVGQGHSSLLTNPQYAILLGVRAIRPSGRT